MAKYWDQILSLLAWGTAFVLFFLGVRKLFQGENALKKRGRFALYVALALALMGWRELPAEETKTPTPKEAQQSKAAEDPIKDTDEWKAFAKFWRLINDKVGEFDGFFAIDEELKPLQTLVDQGKLDKFSLTIIKSACEGYLGKHTKKIATPRPTSRAMPMDPAIMAFRNTLAGIRQTYDVRGVLKAEQRAQYISSIQQRIKDYNAEEQYVNIMATSSTLGEWIFGEAEYFIAEKNALDFWLKEKAIDAETANKIKSELDRVDKQAAKTRDLLKEFIPPIKETKEFKELKTCWNTLDAFDPKLNKAKRGEFGFDHKKHRDNITALSRKGCISASCARTMNDIVGYRILLAEKAMGEMMRLTGEMGSAMGYLSQYNAQVKAILKLKESKKVDDKALTVALNNVMADYLSGKLIMASLPGDELIDELRKNNDSNNQKKISPVPGEKEPNILERNKTYIEEFQESRDKLDELLKKKLITQEEYSIQKQTLEKRLNHIIEVNELVQKLRE